MRISIARADGVVVVDGVMRRVDLSFMDAQVHAVQFDTVSGTGHVEFNEDATVDVPVRDFGAEALEFEAAGNDPVKLNALGPKWKTASVRRHNKDITSLQPFQPCLDAWKAAAPPAPVPPTFSQLLAEAHSSIDGKAEEVRARYITLGSGQAATYIEKATQADEFASAGYAGTVPPMVQAEADATGATPQQACGSIRAQRDAWMAKGAQIERERRRGKTALSAVTAGDTATLTTTLAAGIAALDAL